VVLLREVRWLAPKLLAFPVGVEPPGPHKWRGMPRVTGRAGRAGPPCRSHIVRVFLRAAWLAGDRVLWIMTVSTVRTSRSNWTESSGRRFLVRRRPRRSSLPHGRSSRDPPAVPVESVGDAGSRRRIRCGPEDLRALDQHRPGSAPQDTGRVRSWAAATASRGRGAIPHLGTGPGAAGGHRRYQGALPARGLGRSERNYCPNCA
jgi:hypothetical protein